MSSYLLITCCVDGLSFVLVVIVCITSSLVARQTLNEFNNSLVLFPSIHFPVDLIKQNVFSTVNTFAATLQ